MSFDSNFFAARAFAERAFVMEVASPEKSRVATALLALQVQAAAKGLGSVQGIALADLPRAALVDFYNDKPGCMACQPQQVFQWFPHFTEVHQPLVLTEEVLAERLSFARETGFLLVGPDEAIAILLAADRDPRWNHAERLEIVECFGVSPEGLPRVIYGVHKFNVLPTPPAALSIASLDLMQTKEELYKLAAHQLVVKSNPGVYGSVQLARENRTLELLAEHQKVAQPARTPTGAIRVDGWIENGSASKVSQRLRREGGWLDYSTSEDAWYFGVWINPQRLMLETYTEGDTCTISCENPQQFKAELQRLAAFYGGRRRASGYSCDDKAGTATFECLCLPPFFDGRQVVLKGTDDPPVFVNDKWNPPLQAMLKVSEAALGELKVGQTLALSDAHIMLDLYNPLAFKPFVAELEREGDAQLNLRVSIEGKIYKGHISAPALLEAQ